VEAGGCGDTVSEERAVWMNLDDLSATWPIDRKYHVRPTRRGVSRLTRFVDTKSGSYLLCIHPQGTLLERVRYEHRLLAALAAAGLPFSAPTPVPARTGETIVRVAGGDSLAALFPIISGVEPDPKNVDHTHALGAALGHLHCALAGVDTGPAPTNQGVYGAVDRFLTGTPEPLVPLADRRSQAKTRQLIDALADATG
jgi:Ser/Thr protein kinase RdoA (MazF antagonist)